MPTDRAEDAPGPAKIADMTSAERAGRLITDWSTVVTEYRRRADEGLAHEADFIGRSRDAFAAVLYDLGLGHLAGTDVDVPRVAERLAAAAYSVVYGMAHPLAPLLAAIDAEHPPVQPAVEFEPTGGIGPLDPT